MKELKICRRCKNKFTVVISFEDYGGFAYEGLFPVIYKYYRFDSEEELLNELNKEDMIFVEEVENIYYGGEDVTDKYLITTWNLPISFGNATTTKLLEKWRDGCTSLTQNKRLI